MKDIIVGIPSFNNEKTISFVTEQAAKGLLKYFPDQKTLILNSDGRSKDKTRENFLKTKTPSLEKISFLYKGLSGKGSACKSIFEIAKKERAKAVLLLDADLRNLTLEWVFLLLNPILKLDYDHIAPLYLRHKYDATITNTLAYPLTSALYGKKIRQPLGGSSSFSRRIFLNYLKKDVWQTSVAKFGIDLFATTTAIAEGYKVGQVHLGPVIHDPKDPYELRKMFQEVAETLFLLMKKYQKFWKKVKRVRKIPTLGQKLKQKPPFYPIDLDKLKKYDRITQEEWVKTIFNFFQKEVLKNKDWSKKVGDLIPYYLQATASLILENWDLDNLISEFLRQKLKLKEF